jgi:hypothetical protein
VKWIYFFVFNRHSWEKIKGTHDGIEIHVNVGPICYDVDELLGKYSAASDANIPSKYELLVSRGGI